MPGSDVQTCVADCQERREILLRIGKPTSASPEYLHRAVGGCLVLGPPGTGTSHLAQGIGRAAIQQSYRVIYRELIPISDAT